MHIIQRYPTHDPETPTHNPETPTHTQILSIHNHIYRHFSVSLSLSHINTQSPTHIAPARYILSYIYAISRFIPCGPLRHIHTHMHHLDMLHYHLETSANSHIHIHPNIFNFHTYCPGAFPHTLHWPDTPNVLILSTPPRCTHIPNSYFLPSNVPQTLSSTHLIRLYTY